MKYIEPPCYPKSSDQTPAAQSAFPQRNLSILRSALIPFAATTMALALPASATTVIDEDFSSSASNFTEVEGGTWSVSGGRYVLSSPADSGTNGILGNISVHDTSVSGNQTITAVVRIAGTGSSWDDIALIFNYQDGDNYYYVSLNESNDGYTKGIFKVVGGNPTQLADIGSSIVSDTDYPLEVERIGSTIIARLNSSQVATAIDSTFTGGKVGFGSKNDGGQFDDLTVETPGIPVIDENFGAGASNFTAIAGGTWAVSSGRYGVSSPASGVNDGILENVSLHDTSLTGDFELTALINMTGTSAWDDAAIIFCYQDEDNYYYVALNEQNNSTTHGIFRVASGSATELTNISTSLSDDTDYSVTVLRSGSSITVKVDGSQIATTSDATFSSGQVGFGTFNDVAEFDNLLVYGTASTGQVAAPAFSPGGGTYSSAQNVAITTTTSGASIRYTTDGSTPTSTSGTVYTGTVSIGSGTTNLKAIAYKSGMSDSDVTSESYTITAPATTLDSGDGFYNAALSTTSLNGTFTAEFDATPSTSPMDVAMGLSPTAASDYDDMAAIVRFNISGNIDARDGGSYDAASTISYSGSTSYHFRLVVNVPNHTYSAYVTPGGGSEQTIGIDYDFRSSQSEATSISYQTAIVEPASSGEVDVSGVTLSSISQAVEAPAFSPVGGYYEDTQSVTISTGTSGATIRYTTDGSTPTSTSGTVYSSAVSVSESTTLKAIAYKSGLVDSAVTSANYYIGEDGPPLPNWNDNTWNKIDLSSTSNGLNTKTNFAQSDLDNLDSLSTGKFLFYRSDSNVDTRSTIHVQDCEATALAFVGLEMRSQNSVTALLEVEPDDCGEIWIVGCLFDRDGFITTSPNNKTDAIQLSGGGGDVYLIDSAMVNVDGAYDNPWQHGDCFQHYGNGDSGFDPDIDTLIFFNVRMTGWYQGFGSFDHNISHCYFTNVSYEALGAAANGSTSAYGYYWSSGAQNDVDLENVWHKTLSGQTVSNRNNPQSNPYGILQASNGSGYYDGPLPVFAPDSQIGVNYDSGIQ